MGTAPWAAWFVSVLVVTATSWDRPVLRLGGTTQLAVRLLDRVRLNPVF
jgi:hypothetical protein